MGKINFAVIGCGMVANTHIAALREIPEAQISGVWDISQEITHAFAQKYEVKPYSSFEEVAADKEVQAVCLCMPPAYHVDYGIKLARQGKHIFVEKPISVDVDQGAELVAACRQEGVKLAVVFQNRFTPAAQTVKQALNQGLLGKLVLGDAYVKWYRSPEYYSSNKWRGTWKVEGGAALINQAIHTIDLLQWFMGGVKSVAGFIRTSTHKIEAEDVGVAVVDYTNGAIGVIEGSTAVVPGFKERIEIHGQKGSIALEGGNITMWKVEGCQESDYVKPQTVSYGDTNSPAISYVNHQEQLIDFISAIKEGREPAVTGEEGLKALRIISGIYASSQERKVISLGKESDI